MPLTTQTPKQLLELYLESCRSIGYSPSTMSSKWYRLKSLVEEFEWLPTGPRQVEQWMDRHSGNSDDTRFSAYKDCRAFYNWMVLRRFLPKSQNPFAQMKAPTTSRKVPRWFTWEELGSIFKTMTGARNRAVVMVLLDAGPRIGELGGVTKDNLIDGCLRVSGKTGERLIPLSPVVYAWLRDLPTNALFPKHPPSRDEVLTASYSGGLRVMLGTANRWGGYVAGCDIDEGPTYWGHVPSSGVRVRHPVDRGLCHCLR